MFFRVKHRKKKSFLSWLEFSLSDEASHGVGVILLLLGTLVFALSLSGRAGEAGIALNSMLAALLGDARWSLPVLSGFIVLNLTNHKDKKFDSTNMFGLFLFLLSISSLSYFYSFVIGGGVMGKFVVEAILPLIGEWTTAAIFSSTLIISLLLVFDASIEKIIGKGSAVFRIMIYILSILAIPFVREARSDEEDDEEEDDEDEEDEEEDEVFCDDSLVVKEYEVDDTSEKGKKKKKGKVKKKKKEVSWSKSNVEMNIPLSLLKNKPKKPNSGNIDRNQEIIKRTLLDFGIPVHMGEVRVGPTVTRYSFKPSKGVSVMRVKALSDDLALNLAVHPVRIEAPIPGKSLVGLEVPNKTKVMVSLKEVLQSKIFKNRKSNMMVSLGRDVSGHVWLDDLAKMPHLLIAGATGSGKSIGIHSLIMSLLFQNNPDDLKMILIDVKQVELPVYDGLPYLIAPVVTDNKRAIRSLQWCLGEMEKRLEKLRDAGCQNIADYNKKREERMPYLVVVVDELGDLMATAKKEVEGSIIRLGQKSRAAGIHLILATQRPSVDILSGLIKANMPARMAFTVTSSINSKTILDFTGAEKLLSEGDMLYVNSGLPTPVRIQGSYVDKSEVKAVVDYIKKKAGVGEYIEEVTEKAQRKFNFDEDREDNEDLLQESKQLILDSGKASATMLQSQLAIGYPRANRILSILEKQGVVGPSVQNKPREVFV